MRALFLLMIMAVSVLIGGCGPVSNVPAGKKLEVMATFFPLYDFASQVGGERVHVSCLVPPGISIHDWEPAPGDLVKAVRSDVLVFNGAGLEPWVARVLPEFKGKAIVEASRGIALLRFNQESKSREVENEVTSVYDPHAWIDPVNAEHYVEQIAEGFCRADPAGAAYYRQKAEAYIRRLERLDRDYREAAAGFQRRDIVTSHAAFGYLAARYGLNQIPIAGLSPQAEPSAARLKELVQLVNARGTDYIFFEKLASPRLAEALAREAGVKTLVLSPAAGVTPEEKSGKKDYIAVMRDNLAALKTALGQEGD